MRAWLFQLGTWLVARYGPPPVEPGPVVVLTVRRDALFADARMFTAQQELYADRSGEAKRHQVLALMMKAHPTASQRTIAVAIEAALV